MYVSALFIESVALVKEDFSIEDISSPSIKIAIQPV